MCANPVNFTKQKWSPMDMEDLDRAFENMLKEAREFREVADSLPPTGQKPDTITTPAHLRWRN